MEPTSGPRRLLDAPLWLHAAFLVAVLLLLLPVIGTTGQFSADEGAAIAQAVRLERGDGWTMAHPFPAADPTGAAFPFELSARAGDRYAPFAKHPVYALLLTAADRVGGRAAMIVLSVLGTVAAAALTGLLARRLDDRLGALALWIVGIGSPLFFDSYVVIAHTLAAACAVAAVLCVLRVRDGSSVFALPLVAVSVLGQVLRTEFVFFALALTVSMIVVEGRGAAMSRRLAFLVPVAGAVVGVGLDTIATRGIMSGASATTAAITSTGGGFVADRILGLVVTWLLPSYSLAGDAALLLGAAVAVGLAAFLARTKPSERDGVRLLAAAAGAAGLARLVFGPGAVPGLLIAFPLLTVGLVVVRRDALQDRVSRTLASTFAVYALLVLATQYASGGSGEWGGRYFALGVPVAVPVLLVAARRLVAAMDVTTRRVAIGGACVLTLSLTALAVMTLRDEHADTEAMAAAVAATSSAHPAADGKAPVVLSSDGAAARFAFDVVDRTRWLTADDDALRSYATGLRRLAVGEITFVTRDAEDLRALDGVYRADAALHPGGKWIVYVLVPATAS